MLSVKWGSSIAMSGIWTYDRDCMVAGWGALPKEVYAWFLLHACLGQMVLARMWAHQDGDRLPNRPKLPARCKDWRIYVGVLLLLCSVPFGFQMMNQHSTLYLGFLLSLLPPVLAAQWVMFGHFYMWQPTCAVVPILLETGYTIMLDSFAISRHIWTIYPASGARIPINLFGNSGIQLEQIIVYSMTSAIVVFTLHPLLLVTKAYYQWEVQRSFPSFLMSMVWHDGLAPESPGQLEALAAAFVARQIKASSHKAHPQLSVQTTKPAAIAFLYQARTVPSPMVLLAPAATTAQHINEDGLQLENESLLLEQQLYRKDAIQV